MQVKGNTILITGGASGIGFAYAERFVKAGSTEIVCGRRAEKLEEAKQKLPQLITKVADVAKEEDRVALFEWATSHYPQLNVLVNNAGIQRRTQLSEDINEWKNYQEKIRINLEAPIHLSILFKKQLEKQKDSYIINVSSGLAFVPGTFAPIYSATKAAVHSFTMSLRQILSSSSIKVIEIVPPAVNTDLGGVGLHTFGAPLDEFADSTFQRLENGELEIGFGMSEKNRSSSREEIDEIFKRMNG